MENQTAKLVTYLLPRRGDQVYLVRYKESPNPKRSGWWIPAPELTFGEHPEDCAKRILKSLGVEQATLRAAGIDSFVTKEWHILFYYIGDTTEMPTPGPYYEAGQWFSIDALPAAGEFAHGGWKETSSFASRHKEWTNSEPCDKGPCENSHL